MFLIWQNPLNTSRLKISYPKLERELSVSLTGNRIGEERKGKRSKRTGLNFGDIFHRSKLKLDLRNGNFLKLDSESKTRWKSKVKPNVKRINVTGIQINRQTRPYFSFLSGKSLITVLQAFSSILVHGPVASATLEIYHRYHLKFIISYLGPRPRPMKPGTCN